MIVQTIRFGPDQAQITFIGDDADPRTPANALNVQRCAQPGEIENLELLISNMLLRSVGSTRRVGLPRRQGQVLELLAQGQHISEIARTMYVSESTVKSHLAVLRKRMHVHNSSGLIMAAFRMGWIDH